MLMIIFLMAENPKNLVLSEILDIKKLRQCSKPIEKAHGLPNECYTSPEYLMIERERFLRINGL